MILWLSKAELWLFLARLSGFIVHFLCSQHIFQIRHLFVYPACLNLSRDISFRYTNPTRISYLIFLWLGLLIFTKVVLHFRTIFYFVQS